MGNIFSTNSYRQREDRISELPDDILRLVLSLLPKKSVAQTSVLSRRWAHVWTWYPITDLTEALTGNKAIDHHTESRIINTVLALRPEVYSKIEVSRDPKEEFVLNSKSSRCRKSRAMLGFAASKYVVWSYLRLIRMLFLFRVDFLDVELFSGSSLPCLRILNMFECRGISDLKISRPNLEYLFVNSMDLNSMDISGTRLETLTLWYCFKNKESINGSCDDEYSVNICAPNLQELYWLSNDMAITPKCLIHCFPTLKTCMIQNKFRSNSVTPYRASTRNNVVVHLVCASSHVKKLELSYDAIEVLSEVYEELLGSLPFTFAKLHKLEVDVLAWNKSCVPGLACLLKSSPLLYTLEICVSSRSDDEGNLGPWNDIEDPYWESQAENLNPFLSHLKKVEIRVAVTMIPKNAISFAKFLLKYGTGLEEMNISWKKSDVPSSASERSIALLEAAPRSSALVKLLTYRN